MSGSPAMILDETSSTCLHWSTFELNLRSLLDGAAKSLSRSPARILDETLSIWLFGAFLTSTWSPPPLAGAAQALSYSPARILHKTLSIWLLWTTFELNLGSPPLLGLQKPCSGAQQGFSTKPYPYGYFGALLG